MPLFATLVVVCALSAEGDKAVCDIVVDDKFQSITQPICFNKLERVRYKAAVALIDRLKSYELMPGSHNCFQTVAHRDSALELAVKAYDKAGVTYSIIRRGY